MTPSPSEDVADTPDGLASSSTPRSKTSSCAPFAAASAWCSWLFFGTSQPRPPPCKIAWDAWAESKQKDVRGWLPGMRYAWLQGGVSQRRETKLIQILDCSRLFYTAVRMSRRGFRVSTNICITKVHRSLNHTRYPHPT